MSLKSEKRVVVIGGGYVGAQVARALDDAYEVVLIDKLPVFFHRIAALRAAVDPDSAELPFLSRDNLLANGQIVVGEVVGIRPDDHAIDLSDGATIDYDVAIIATGTLNQPVAQFVGSDVSSADAHFEELRLEIAQSSAVAIIGAGVTGVELAGEVKSVHPDKPVILFARGRIVPDLPAKAAAKLLKQLQVRGVQVVDDVDVAGDNADEVLRGLGFDPATTCVLQTTGATPETAWLETEHPDWLANGEVVVDAYLRVGGRDDLFAVGDVAATPGQKGAMNARAQIPVIKANIAAGRPSKTYKPSGPRVALVPLGRDGGVVSVGLGSISLLLGSGAASKAKGKSLLTPMINKSLGNG